MREIQYVLCFVSLLVAEVVGPVVYIPIGRIYAECWWELVCANLTYRVVCNVLVGVGVC